MVVIGKYMVHFWDSPTPKGSKASIIYHEGKKNKAAVSTQPQSSSSWTFLSTSSSSDMRWLSQSHLQPQCSVPHVVSQSLEDQIPVGHERLLCLLCSWTWLSTLSGCCSRLLVLSTGRCEGGGLLLLLTWLWVSKWYNTIYSHFPAVDFGKRLNCVNANARRMDGTVRCSLLAFRHVPGCTSDKPLSSCIPLDG